ncbi:TPA: hypothetical protein ACKULY_001045 [Neisseria gonorrhoeae]
MPPEAFQTAFCLVSADGTAAVIRTSGINFQTRNGTPSTARKPPPEPFLSPAGFQ